MCISIFADAKCKKHLDLYIICDLLCTQWNMNGTGTPLSFGTELFQGDLDRLEEHLMHCAELIPQFGTCGIQAVINGPVSWPPDGNPILGPVHDDKVKNYWAACGMSYGIAHAGMMGVWQTKSVPCFYSLCSTCKCFAHFRLFSLSKLSAGYSFILLFQQEEPLNI